MNEMTTNNQPVTSAQDPELADKFRLFNEYFSVEQQVDVNILPFELGQALPSYQEFMAAMPYAFRLASEVSTLEVSSIRPLRNLGAIGDDLVEFLNAQSRKIDLIMSYILSIEDDQHQRLQTQSFGGGGLTIVSSEQLAIGQIAQLKLFLTEEASAIFCYGEVIDIKKITGEAQDKYLISLYYAHIREEDRELIVRASLHQQSKQLKRKAETKRK